MNRKRAAVYILLVILAGIPARLPLAGIFEVLGILLSNGIYISLVCHWSITVNRRIMQKRIRLYVLLIVVCMLLLLLIHFEESILARRSSTQALFLRYLVFLPTMLIPLLSYYATLYIGKAPGWKQNRSGFLLIVPTALIVGLILTNGRHQLAFRLVRTPLSRSALSIGSSVYSYGPLYYAALIWAFCLLLLALWRLYRRCRLSNAARLLRAPLAAILLCALWAVLYSAFPPPFIFHSDGAPVILCAMTISTWECLLVSGLIPANSNYDALFLASTIAAQITDADFHVVYSSELAEHLPEDVMREAEHRPVMLDEDHYLNSTPISGGHLLWTEDRTQINENLARLRQTQTMLEENRELLKAEYALKKDRVKVDVQNRLYDRIASEIRPQLGVLSSVLSGMSVGSESFDKELAALCVTGAFVKRRSNLMLICENAPQISAAEVQHCIRESLEYLSVYGVACSMDAQPDGQISAQQAKLLYDLFEAVTELALPTLRSLFVRLSASGGTAELKMVCEDAAQLPSRNWQRQRIVLCRGALAIQQYGRESYISLALRNGGDGI